MPLNSVFSWIMKKRVHQIALFRQYPNEVQGELFEALMEAGSTTTFGYEHGMHQVKRLEDFRKAVPIRNYAELEPYIKRARTGEHDVLWPGKVKWFAKSSGTTAGQSKFIPVTKEALEDCHYKGGKDLLALYYHCEPEATLFNGKHLIVGGTAGIDSQRGVHTGDLSAIIIKNLPFWVELKRTPNREIALMQDWDRKIERMARATLEEDVVIIAGVPSWTLLLVERVLELAGTRDLKQVWPNLQLFMHGGVSFKPYRSQYDALLPSGGVHYFETYNASEGFFGIQDRTGADDMLLMLDYGIFYEFMPLSEYGKDDPETVSLQEVEVGVQYAPIITTNGGLWRYMIGDTVKFTSLDPFRIQVTGRTKHFINAFGEELIVEDADEAVRYAAAQTGASVAEYTAAPIYMQGALAGGHEWVVEFTQPPTNFDAFVRLLDIRLKEINTDYRAKRSHDMIVRAPVVHRVAPGTFYRWMDDRGKLGGQHKVPRLSNERTLLEQLLDSVAVA